MDKTHDLSVYLTSTIIRDFENCSYVLQDEGYLYIYNHNQEVIAIFSAAKILGIEIYQLGYIALEKSRKAKDKPPAKNVRPKPPVKYEREVMEAAMKLEKQNRGATNG